MATEGDEFYLTIPNWDSMDYYENTIGDFRIQLPYPIHLRGEWSVGLSQILYHQTWYNIEEGQNEIKIKNNQNFYNVEISAGFYENEVALIGEINKNISSTEIKADVSFHFNKYNNRCSINLPRNEWEVNLHEHLARILGLSNIIHSTQEGIKPVNLHIHKQSIYIYCDIIGDQVIGGDSWKLLRFLPNETKAFGTIVSKVFDTPQYIPVQTKQFQSLHVKICNQHTEVIKFTRGISMIQLHFKLTRIPLFY
jgi:hypothetical protein